MAPPRKLDAPKPEPSPLALRIRHARAHSELPTDAAFAKACGFDGRAFWRYATENVKPSTEVLREIARVGGIDLVWLIGNDPPIEPAASTKPTLEDLENVVVTVDHELAAKAS